MHMDVGIILFMRLTNQKRRYFVTSSLIGWAHKQNDSCGWRTVMFLVLYLSILSISTVLHPGNSYASEATPKKMGQLNGLRAITCEKYMLWKITDR